MSVWLALLLGIVQGLCEFLPISSSGHLLLISRLFGVQTEGSAFFTVMLHMATLVAVCIVYRKILWELLKKPVQKLVGQLILATLPTVVFTLLLKKFMGGFFADMEDGAYLGVAFILTAAFLLFCDSLMVSGQKKRNLEQMTWKDALKIGGMQCIGVFPGVSRSGSTITGAVASGLDRRAAADFSFLMSIPAILGGTVLEAKDAISAGSIGVSVPALLVGMLAAGVTGYFAVRFMIALITKRKLWGFAIYTAVLGVVVIILQLVGKV